MHQKKFYEVNCQHRNKKHQKMTKTTARATAAAQATMTN
jgi:hypothetical protein